jgi:hypothetical protein
MGRDCGQNAFQAACTSNTRASAERPSRSLWVRTARARTAPDTAVEVIVRRMDRLLDCRIHLRVFVGPDRPRGTGPHSVTTRAAETAFVACH